MQNSDLISKKSFYRRRRFWVAGIYLFLLICSGVHRYGQPEKTVSPDKKTISLNEIDGENIKPEKIRFAYKEFLPEKDSDKLPVILLHGSPGEAEVFDSLAPFLKDRRLIAVDLPGFGDSTAKISDYSVKAHAQYVIELLNQLKIEKAHIVGFSMGGGVVLEMAKIAPQPIASISMVSAIGIQEYELFGNYYLNHAIHGVQLAAFWILQELTPNFGFFDGAMPYARNFYDTDQRPLRKILENVKMPFQIVHGIADPLIPIEAAREHFRLVPQSEFHELDDNHFMVFQRPEKLRIPLEDFWQRVENGTAKTRENADAERISEANRPFRQEIIAARGATAFVYFLLFAVSTFISEDLTALIAGIFSAQGRFGFVFVLIACLFGIYSANFFVFLTGRFFGRKILQTAPFRVFITRQQFEKFSVWLKNNQLKAIFLSRFFFGFRLPVYFVAGMLRMNFWKLLFGFFAASVFWTSILLGISYLLTTGLIKANFINKENTLILITLFFALYFIAQFLIGFSKRTEREL